VVHASNSVFFFAAFASLFLIVWLFDSFEWWHSIFLGWWGGHRTTADAINSHKTTVLEPEDFLGYDLWYRCVMISTGGSSTNLHQTSSLVVREAPTVALGYLGYWLAWWVVVLQAKSESLYLVIHCRYWTVLLISNFRFLNYNLKVYQSLSSLNFCSWYYEK
jgi:hypothetical protein